MGSIATVCIGDAINWDHPLNRGLVSEWAVLPEQQRGVYFRDLCMRSVGTLTNGPTWSGLTHPGGNGSLGFDGSNDLVLVSANPTTAVSSWMLSAWAYPTALSQFSIIAANGNDANNNGWGFGMNVGNGAGAGDVFVGLFAGVAWMNSGYTFPSANRWYHLAMGRDAGGTTRFWVDGIQTANTFAYAPNAPANNLFSIGAQVDATTPTFFRHWNGMIDGVCVWASYHDGGFKICQESRQGNPNRWNWTRRPYYVEQAGGAATPLTRYYYEHLLAGAL